MNVNTKLLHQGDNIVLTDEFDHVKIKGSFQYDIITLHAVTYRYIALCNA